MRLVQLAILTTLAVASARADYQYFYPCDLGVMDCDAFPKHDYGDFGMSGGEATLITPGGGLRGIVLCQRGCEQYPWRSNRTG